MIFVFFCGFLGYKLNIRVLFLKGFLGVDVVDLYFKIW